MIIGFRPGLVNTYELPPHQEPYGDKYQDGTTQDGRPKFQIERQEYCGHNKRSQRLHDKNIESNSDEDHGYGTYNSPSEVCMGLAAHDDCLKINIEFHGVRWSPRCAYANTLGKSHSTQCSAGSRVAEFEDVRRVFGWLAFFSNKKTTLEHKTPCVDYNSTKVRPS